LVIAVVTIASTGIVAVTGAIVAVTGAVVAVTGAGGS
jgi:hypothetical protein